MKPEAGCSCFCVVHYKNLGTKLTTQLYELEIIELMRCGAISGHRVVQ